MPFAIASAPEVFEKTMVEVFEGIDGIEIIHDDVLVTGRTTKELDHNLHKVLQRARERNAKLNKEKLKICIPEVKYIGDIVVIDVATLLCVLVKYAVAKLHMLYLNVFRRSIGIRATIKTCLFFVSIFENRRYL